MSAKLPDGATLALATTYGAAKTMSVLTNANPGLATLGAGHGITSGDFFEVTSGWSALNGRTVKATFPGSPEANDVILTNINTLDLTRFPAGTGIGTVREITAWTTISQVLGFETTGGEPGKVTYAFLDEDFERSLPSVSSAQEIKITIADDDTLAGYLALKAASDDRSLRALKLTLNDGSVIVYTGTCFLNETPTVAKGAVMTVAASFSLQARPVRY